MTRPQLTPLAMHSNSCGAAELKTRRQVPSKHDCAARAQTDGDGLCRANGRTGWRLGWRMDDRQTMRIAEAKPKRRHAQQREQEQRQNYSEGERARPLDRRMMGVIQVAAAVSVAMAHHHTIMLCMVMMGVVLTVQDHGVSKAGARAAQHHKPEKQNAASRPQGLLYPVLEHTHDQFWIEIPHVCCLLLRIQFYGEVISRPCLTR